jgi:hypothetical protein
MACLVATFPQLQLCQDETRTHLQITAKRTPLNWQITRGSPGLSHPRLSDLSITKAAKKEDSAKKAIMMVAKG